MSEAQERREMQRTRGRLDQLMDDVAALLEQIRDEIARERADRAGGLESVEGRGDA